MTETPKAELQRSPGNSARWLRLTRTLLMLLCVLVAGLIAIGASAAGNALDSVARNSRQVITLHEIKAGFLSADGLATSGITLGKAESAAHRQSYLDTVRSVSALTAEASKNVPAHQTTLDAVNAQLIDYIITMESARSTYAVDAKVGQDIVTQAGRILADKTVPALDGLIKSSTAAAEPKGLAGFGWVAWAALLPALAVLGVSVWLAIRSKRLLNPGLLAALIVLIVMWRLVDGAFAHVGQVNAGDWLGTARSAVAYSAIAEAKSVEGRMMLYPSTAAEQQSTWDKALNVVENLRPDSMAEAVKTYRTEHAQLLVAMKGHSDKVGEWASQHPTLHQSYADLAKGLEGAANGGSQKTAGEIASAKSAIGTTNLWAGLLALLGAAASAVGISQRLRDER